MEILEKYLNLLFGLFQYDVEIFSQKWIYYWVIPAIGYFVFFWFKWLVLTAPLWMPVRMALSGAASLVRFTSNKLKSK